MQYDLGSDAYRILHTFDKAISVHRITRRNSTDYYILSAKAISQDRSASTLPRPIDSTGYAYDSAAAESEIKILRYNASTNTLTEHVPEDDTYPPQLGIHYHVGFENAIYIDDFEGIVPDYRGEFKSQSNILYYRYAKDDDFGVAQVNTSGTTSKRIGIDTSFSFGKVLYCVHGSTPKSIYVFPEDTPNNGRPSGADVRAFNTPSVVGQPQSIALSGNNLFIGDQGGREIVVTPENTVNGGTGAIVTRFNLPNIIPNGMAISGNNLFVTNSSNGNVSVMPADTGMPYDPNDIQDATITRQFSPPTGLSSPSAMTIQGNDLYIADSNEVFVMPADTPNGQTAVASRRFNRPPGVGIISGMAIHGNSLLLAEPSGDDIVEIPADTANGATATITRRFNLPSGLTSPTGLTIGDAPLNPINYQNHLNTAFALTTGNVIYFVYATGNADTSALVIRRRTSGGTVSTILTDRKVLSALTDLDDGGGAYLGCYEAVFLNNELYMLCPIQRVDEDSSDYTRSQTKAAGMVLFRCDVTAATPTLTVIETWDFATHSACNLIVHDNAVHYVERSAAAERFKPINSSL